jgi:hypothetical protein
MGGRDTSTAGNVYMEDLALDASNTPVYNPSIHPYEAHLRLLRDIGSQPKCGAPVCPHWTRGHCKNGSKCSEQHHADNLPYNVCRMFYRRSDRNCGSGRHCGHIHVDTCRSPIGGEMRTCHIKYDIMPDYVTLADKPTNPTPFELQNTGDSTGAPVDLTGLNQILSVRIPTQLQQEEHPHKHPSDYGSRSFTSSRDSVRPKHVDIDSRQRRRRNDDLDTIDEEHPATAQARSLIECLLDANHVGPRQAYAHRRALLKFLEYMERDDADVPHSDLRELQDHASTLYDNLTSHVGTPHRGR